MSPELRLQLLARARGLCECGCGAPLRTVEIDHFFGRAKAPEIAQTCWALRPGCHHLKTLNRPSAVHWLLKFIKHAGRHGYAFAAAQAQRKLDWVTAKGISA